MDKSKKWRDYEEVSEFLINQLRQEFGMQRVEGKQKSIGVDTGTEWEVEAKGVSQDGNGIIIIECRRYTTSRQNQEKIAGMTYRIIDTKAQGGIMISPLGFQKGAEKIAKANNIVSVMIDSNSTPQRFAVDFMHKLFLGTVMDVGGIKISSTTTLTRKCVICDKIFTIIDNETVCDECNV